MKLIDLLNQKIEAEADYAERILKIGSATGYFYCGTAGNFMKNMESYDIAINKFFRSAAASYYSQYVKQLKNPPKIVDYAKETKPLGEREVVENRMADAAVDKGVEIILVEGLEIGRIWLSCETAEKGEFAFKPIYIYSENE